MTTVFHVQLHFMLEVFRSWAHWLIFLANDLEPCHISKVCRIPLSLYIPVPVLVKSILEITSFG